jgi:hypothetical protein
MKTIVERVQAPTPKFFRVLRNIGLVLAAVSGTIIASSITVPAIVTSIATYLGLAGAVASAVSQLTVPESKKIE